MLRGEGAIIHAGTVLPKINNSVNASPCGLTVPMPRVLPVNGIFSRVINSCPQGVTAHGVGAKKAAALIRCSALPFLRPRASFARQSRN